MYVGMQAPDRPIGPRLYWSTEALIDIRRDAAGGEFYQPFCRPVYTFTDTQDRSVPE
jgi:hypothetical protein